MRGMVCIARRAVKRESLDAVPVRALDQNRQIEYMVSYDTN